MSDHGGDDSKPSTPASPHSVSSSFSSAATATSSDASSTHIQVFARIRPSKLLSPAHLQYDPYSNAVTLTVPNPSTLPTTSSSSSTTTTATHHADQFTRDYINNQRSIYPFTFHGLFPPSTTQSTVFDTIGKQCVTSLLDGYNSTIFAYGQTGSGKTFTITGGVESYEDRGIIPRTLSYLFQQLESQQSQSAGSVNYTVRVSYLEIYNEAGYDLLDRPADMTDLASITASSLAHLPRVSLLEDDNRCVHLQNLGEYTVSNVQDALELLFRGDTNRIVCETPSNDASSRSHCLFTVTLEGRDSNSGKMRRSKLHLVDLAGSERIKKTQVTGRLFKEAAFINLSLHHLEQVILALHNRSNSRSSGSTVHIPYRNSFLTSTLRDSLGGNCRTYMIATLSGEPSHIDESVSTARFAGRVGSIRNEVWREEAEDMEGMVKRLKGQVKDLKDEVRKLRGDKDVGRDEVLNDEEKERCREMMRRYVYCTAAEEGEVSQQVSVAHQEKVRYYLKVMKEMIRGGAAGGKGKGEVAASDDDQRVGSAKAEEEVKRLSGVVQEKDEEISRLKEALSHAAATQQPQQHHQHQSPQPHNNRPTSSSTSRSPPSPHTTHPTQAPAPAQSSLDSFRLQYAQHEQLEQRKDELTNLIRTAKHLGESINTAKNNIIHLKQRLTAHTLNRTLAQQEGKCTAAELAAMEAAEREVVGEMEDEKRVYRERFVELKGKKEEIVHLQGLIERGRRTMEMEFEKWKKATAHNTAAAATEAAESGESAADDSEEQQRQRESDEMERQQSSSRRGETPKQQRPHQTAVSRSTDGRVYEEMKEQVAPVPQHHQQYQQQQQQQSHQPLPANNRSSIGRDAHRPVQPPLSAGHSSSSTPNMSPLRAGALSSLMLSQSPATGGVLPNTSAAVAGNGSASTMAGAGSRVVRTGNAVADAEIDKFWALRDKLKTHAAAVQTAVATITPK